MNEMMQVHFQCPDCNCHRVMSITAQSNHCAGIGKMINHEAGHLYTSHAGGISVHTFSDWVKDGQFVGYFCYRCKKYIATTKEELWKWLEEREMLSPVFVTNWEHHEVTPFL